MLKRNSVVLPRRRQGREGGSGKPAPRRPLGDDRAGL